MCQWWAIYRHFDRALGEAMHDPDTSGRVMRQTVASWDKFASIASQFGLTPADRAKLKVEPDETPDDKEKRFFA